MSADPRAQAVQQETEAPLVQAVPCDLRDDRDWLVQLVMDALDRLWSGDDDSYPTDRREAEVAVDALMPWVAAREAAAHQQEASAWMDTVEQLQHDVERLKVADQRRLAMLALHCGYGEGSAPMQCSGGCGQWPCATYLACYPEEAWRVGELPQQGCQCNAWRVAGVAHDASCPARLARGGE